MCVAKFRLFVGFSGFSKKFSKWNRVSSFPNQTLVRRLYSLKKIEQKNVRCVHLNSLSLCLHIAQSPVPLSRSSVVQQHKKLQDYWDKVKDQKSSQMGPPLTMPPEVVKSPNDKKDYRVVCLDNGLTALLVSDIKSTKSAGDNPQNDSEKLSAAALCIGAGSFSDPTDIPGLAHFLEHMVFMGSEKYPDENEFDSFIKVHGGGSNAYTDCERTVFYFDVSLEKFKEALDRFANFFIHPLMKKDSVDREIKAVDSEFDMSRPVDSNRKEQLFGSMAREGHPMGKFMWGNITSLKTTPEEQGIDIYERLQSFYRDMYSSHYMTLTVQSKDTLDNLEQMVKEIFSPVPNNEKEKHSFHQLKDPFDASFFHKLYKAIPVRNTDQVEISWALPTQQHKYRVKPLHYLGWLVGHEGKGSILSYLKEKLWAVSLSGGNSETGFEHNSTYAMFAISITLTPLGVEHVQEVLTSVFEYLEMLRREGPSERIYREQQIIEDNSFRWIDEIEPIEYVEKMCENMQLFPVKDYLTGEHLMFQYDPQLITEVLGELVPGKASILFYMQKYKQTGECNVREPWFDTPYTVTDIPQEWLNHWNDIEPSSVFHLPTENAFIATDFDLRDPDIPAKEFPTLISSTEQCSLWYKKDNKYNVPKAYLYFNLKNVCVNNSPHNAALFDLFINLVERNLSEVAYDADVAELSYSLTSNYKGLVIKCNGFNHKLSKLFETIVDHIAGFDVKDDVFESTKNQLKRSYHNRSIKSDQFAKDVRLSIIQHHHWTAVDKYECLAHLTPVMLRCFVREFLGRLKVDGYVHGNMTSIEVKQLESYLITKLQTEPLPNICHPVLRTYAVPNGEKYICVENCNKKDNNSVIVNYYQYGPAGLDQLTMNELLIMQMEEPCFDILRTREQLGYSVYCINHNTNGILGFSINVCSQADKFSTADVDKKIESFLLEFEKEHIEDLGEEQFRKIVKALQTLKKCEDSHMKEEADRNWSEISYNDFFFDRLPKQIAILDNLTLKDYQSWMKGIVPSGGCHKKLSVQVAGNPDASSKKTNAEDSDEDGDAKDDEGENEDEDEESDEEEDDEEESMEITDENNDSANIAVTYVPQDSQTTLSYITDIKTFCDRLTIFPVSSITK